MPQIGPGGEVHSRFFILAGLVRHEYWLHGLRAEDYGFTADPDTLTLSAKRQHNGDLPCSLSLTDEMMQRDLHSLARSFFKEHCLGVGSLAKREQKRA